MNEPACAVFLTGGWINYSFSGMAWVSILLFASALVSALLSAFARIR